MRDIVAHTRLYFCIYLKRPPPDSKKTAPNLYLFKTPPLLLKKTVTNTKEPLKRPNYIFIQNAPPCFQIMRLQPEKSQQSDQISDLRLKHWPHVVVGRLTAFKNSDIYRARSQFQTYWPHEVVGWVTAG